MKFLGNNKLFIFVHNDQAINYFRTIIEEGDPLVQHFPQLSKTWEEFKTIFGEMSATFNRPRSNPLSPGIAGLERSRDKEFKFISRVVNAILRFSTIEDEIPHAIALARIIKPYKNLTSQEEGGETALINSLLKQLETDETKAHISALHLTPHVAAIKAFNTEFESKIVERAQIDHGKKQEGTASQHLRQTVRAFTRFKSTATSLADMITSPDEMAILEDLCSKINANTEQLAAVVNRHRAFLQRKEKGSDEE
jgi:hypothetical protein